MEADMKQIVDCARREIAVKLALEATSRLGGINDMRMLLVNASQIEAYLKIGTVPERMEGATSA